MIKIVIKNTFGFIFERVDLLEYHLHKISFNRGSLYIKSPEWIINKHETINPQNTENNRCLQYVITVALHHKNITDHPERITNISPFINNYNWKDIECPSYSKDWKKFEQNNKRIALNILFVPYNTKQIRQAHISKYNSKRDNQVILLMITDGEKWHYVAVKSISRLLRGITSNHDGDFYCLNCFRSYTTKRRLKKHERICRDHDFYYLKMPDENNKILRYIHGEKSLKVPFIIYADLECLLKKIDTCKNNPEKPYTEKKAKHKPSGYSLVTCCSFDKFKNKRKYYRGKDFIEMFCKDLRDQAMKIINYEKKNIIPLTNEKKEAYENQKNCHICEKEFFTDENNEKEFKQMQKVRDHCHYTRKYREAAHSICNLRYKIPKEIPVVFHNGSTYDYHFIIKQLAKEFKGSFDCLGENTEKYITFSVTIKKEHDNDKAIIYKLKFIDSYRFMQASLSSLADNLSGIDKKEPENKFIDNMRSMMVSLSQSIDKVSEIDKKISQIDKKEPENKFIDNVRSMMASLSQSIDKVSEIDKKNITN